MASVLIVDDEPDVGDALRRVLERAGHTVRTLTNGADALAEQARGPADIVITDIMMAKVHGLDVIRAIRSSGAATRIIAISGGGNFGPLGYQPEAITTSAYLVAASKAGADAVLTKPFDKDEILSTVQRLLT